VRAHLLLLLLLPSMACGHLSVVCSSAGYPGCTQFHFYFGTYHSPPSAGGSVPGQFHLKSPQGQTTSGIFNVFRPINPVSGSFSSLYSNDLAGRMEASLRQEWGLHANDSVQCYKMRDANPISTNLWATDVLTPVQAADQCYTLEMHTWYRASLSNVISGTYEMWKTGTDINLDPAYSPVGSPCTMNPSKHFAFDVTSCDGGSGCPGFTGNILGASIPTSCQQQQFSGFVCPATCAPGKVKTGQLECKDGVWENTLVCADQTCSAPTNADYTGIAGIDGPGCGIQTAKDTSCTPVCQPGFYAPPADSLVCGENGDWTCLTANSGCGCVMTTTTATACDATAAPTNGATGDCPGSLASGSTCQPTCQPGYIVSGSSSCLAGELTAATCPACMRWADDGCETEGSGDDGHVASLHSVTGGDKFGARCCKDNSNSCHSPHDCEDDSFDFQEASDKCTDLGGGYRLCTLEELNDERCCGTGGMCDNHKIWTSTPEAGCVEAPPAPQRAAADGCGSEGSGDDGHGPAQLHAVTESFGVRCCSDNDNMCTSPRDCHHSSGRLTFHDANAVCLGLSPPRRLCTVAEIESDKCCSTGGLCDNFKIWTSDVTLASVASQACTTFTTDATCAATSGCEWSKAGDQWTCQNSVYYTQAASAHTCIIASLPLIAFAAQCFV